MSTLQTVAIKHASSASNNIVLDSSGNVTFAGTPVPNSSFLRNRIINGAMDFAQRGTSFVAASTGYTVDRWRYALSSGAVSTLSQNSDVPTGSGFQYSLRSTITTADTSIGASEFALIQQNIEGFNVVDLVGQTFTLSFRVRSSNTGTHCISFINEGNNRSFVVEYTVNAVNTWETKSVTVTGGLITAGTWNFTNGLGLQVNFLLAVGSTFQTAAGSWQTGQFFGTSNQVNCLGTNGNIFAITGVQLEVGNVATPFERRQFGQELALCQRYYNRDVLVAVGGGATPTVTNRTFYCSVNWPVSMRAAPTMTLISTLASTNMNAGAWVNLTASRGRFSATNSVANDCALEAQYSAEIEL
jgi:hypothetical protein